MNTTTLQIPVSKSLKQNAQDMAKKLGFSSLQEVVRLFLTQLVNKKITVGITVPSQTPDEILTPEQEKVLLRKYKEAKKDIAQGNYYVAHSVEEMMEQLRS